MDRLLTSDELRVRIDAGLDSFDHRVVRSILSYWISPRNRAMTGYVTANKVTDWDDLLAEIRDEKHHSEAPSNRRMLQMAIDWLNENYIIEPA